jgi:hypothetical protein
LTPGVALPIGFAVSAPPPPPPSAGAAECWTATAQDVDAFVKRARQGETFVYAHGPVLVQGAAAARVAQLTASGDVIPHHRRAADNGFDFIIRRQRRPQPKRPPVCDPLMLSVLVVLQEAAGNHERCPSDAAIGEATGLTADQVKWQLKKLKGSGFVRVTTVPTPRDSRFRVVTVVATGSTTAGPPA